MKVNNKILALLIVFIAIVSVSAVSAEDIAADDVVAAPVDDVAVVEASADADNVLSTTHEIPADASVSDIETIINQTSAGDTLNFAANATYDFGNISKGVEITHTLILQGNGATIQGYQGFSISADEESVDNTEVHNLNFIMTQDVLYQGRALEFFAGDAYVIDGCTFTNGNSGIYIRNGKGSTNKITITNCEFYGEDGATDHSSIGTKTETGMKAINIMGGSGITISNNTFEGDMLDAVSIASGASNVEMYNNNIVDVWYGVFYGGGITNITVQDNTFSDNKVYALGIIKAAGDSDISANLFITPENATAIYVEEGNTAHGAPSNIETIHIYNNIFLGANSVAVASESKGGMITPKGDFTVVYNEYENGVTVFSFNDNNTYTFTSSNFVSEDKRVYIEDNTVLKPEIGEITIDSEYVNATLAEDATGYLLIDVDGIGYYVPVEDGGATFLMPELAPGEYTIVATYTGDANYETLTNTENITIEEPPETIISENLLKIEKSPDNFEATFLNLDGTALANTTVEFNLNGGTYKRTTNANGTATMAINLVPGDYTISMTNPVTGEEKENSIEVLPRLLADDLTKYYRNESQFYVLVLDDEGNRVGAGEIVTFNINGVLYNRTTNASGIAKLNINLVDDVYIVTSEYKGCQISNTITVLPILTGEDLTKKYGELTPFEATLVDGQGNPYAGQTVTFNINGVMYQRTTDSNGVAKLNINLQAGEYIITSTYNGFSTSNKVTITA